METYSFKNENIEMDNYDYSTSGSIPLVAVIVPVYNDEEYLEACLDSISNQTVPWWEAWLVDDCSTDDSLAIIKRYCENDPRFHMLRNETNSSAWVSRAKGILATSDSVKYILFADADDTIQPDEVERAYELMEQEPVDILHFGTNVANCSNISRERIRRYTAYLQPDRERLYGREVFDSFVERNFEGHLWNKMFNASLLKEVITHFGVNRILPKAQDKALYWAVCWYKKNLTYRSVSERLYNYNYGLGVEGDDSKLTLEQYKQYLCQAHTENFISEVMEEHPEDKEELYDILSQSRYNLIRHSVKNYLRIPDSIKPDALKMASEYWNNDFDKAYLTCALAEYTWNDRITSAGIFEKSEIYKSGKRPSDFKVIGTYYHRMDNGGIQRVIANIIEYWHDMGYDVVLFTDCEPSENDYVLPEYVTRVKIDRPQSKCTSTNYHERGMSLARLIKKHNVDCMVYHSYFSDVLLYDICICKSMNVPFIMYEHNVFTKFLHTNDVKFSTIPIFSKLADSIVCLSKIDKAWWDCFHPNVHIVLNPLTFSIEECSAAPRNNHNILFLCRFDENAKRPNDAISIAKSVIEKIPDAKLYMVGTSENKPYLEGLKNRIKRLHLEDKIIMCGFHADVAQFYNQCSVFLSCSSHEGFMLTLCEAMGFRIPIVMYELPYLATTENNPGIVSVPQGDVESASEVICELFEDNSKLMQIGNAGFEYLCEMYKTDIASQWNEVFLSIGRSSKYTTLTDMQNITHLIVESYIYGVTVKEKKLSELNEKNKSLEKEKSDCDKKIRQLESMKKLSVDLKLDRLERLESDVLELKKRIKKNDNLEIELIQIRSSFTYKIGRIITWLPRKIRGLFARKKQ